MKIAMVASPYHDFPPVMGSIANQMFEVAKRIVPHVDEVAIFCPYHKTIRKEEVIENVRIIRVPTLAIARYFDHVVGIKLCNALNLLSKVQVPCQYRRHFFLFYILRIATIIKREQFDIIDLYCIARFAFWLKLLNPRAKLIWHPYTEIYLKRNCEVLLNNRNLVDLILTPSRFIANRIKEMYPSYRDKCHVWLPGADIALFRPFTSEEERRLRQKFNIKNEKVILYAGKVAPEKGIHVLLSAFNEVVATYPNVKLIIVGEFAMLSDKFITKNGQKILSTEDYKKMLDMLVERVKEKVVFVGWIPHHRLVEMHNIADIFVHPVVIHEAFGMAIAEAMAAGLPVVASKMGGVPELIENGISGILVEPNDSHALKEAILKLIKDDTLREKMSIESRKRAERFFSWQRAANEFLQFIANA